jgi:hypothetical protein
MMHRRFSAIIAAKGAIEGTMKMRRTRSRRCWRWAQ